MSDFNIDSIYKTKMSESEFYKLSKFIYNEYGIKLPIVKKTMLEGRLHKRLRSLNMKSFSDYIDFVFSSEGKKQELFHMIDMVTTNKTDFFREPVHFDYLTNVVVPEFVAKNPRGKLKVWSAGSSSGEEPYTIAIVLNELVKKKKLTDYEIWGSDISVRMLQASINAVYKEERIANIPIDLKKKYFLRSKDKANRTVRVVSELRHKVKFYRINFIDATYDMPNDFDLIFCRNVIIYFDRTTQENVIKKLCYHLKPNKHFFLGHSESISNMNVPLIHIRPTIFKRK